MRQVVVLALCSALALFGLFGVRPLRTPYEFVRTMSSASSYWVEWEEGRPAYVCHKYGWRYPVDVADPFSPVMADITYYGAGGYLAIVHVPGIAGESFLVFESCLGAYSFRRILFRVTSFGRLVRVADIATVAEIMNDGEDHVVAATFQDIDGDGVEELVEMDREWVYDEHGELVNNWGLRCTFFAWDGSGFRRRYQRAPTADGDGPLIDLR